MQIIAGPSVITKVDSEEEADPYLKAAWCTEDEYTPEETKLHEKGPAQQGRKGGKYSPRYVRPCYRIYGTYEIR